MSIPARSAHTTRSLVAAPLKAATDALKESSVRELPWMPQLETARLASTVTKIRLDRFNAPLELTVKQELHTPRTVPSELISQLQSRLLTQPVFLASNSNTVAKEELSQWPMQVTAAMASSATQTMTVPKELCTHSLLRPRKEASVQKESIALSSTLLDLRTARLALTTLTLVVVFATTAFRASTAMLLECLIPSTVLRDLIAQLSVLWWHLTDQLHVLLALTVPQTTSVHRITVFLANSDSTALELVQPVSLDLAMLALIVQSAQLLQVQQVWPAISLAQTT